MRSVVAAICCALTAVFASCAKPPPLAWTAPTAGAAAIGSGPNATQGPAVRSEPDPLGPKPSPGPPASFRPPAPEILPGPGRSKVWLLERHGLPIVTIAVVTPYGSAAEPVDKAGLASAAADMMDEGAGDKGALAFSSAIDDLGARLAPSAHPDATVVSLEVLTSRLEPALALLADAIVRPRHDEKEWRRVRSLWVNALKARAHDPDEVAKLVTALAHYGDEHPYGHPSDGTLSSSARVRLSDIVQWHRSIWRPDTATFIVVGDVTREEIGRRLATAFGAWTAPATPVPPMPRISSPEARSLRTMVVDRPDAPQVVLSLARPGLAANDPDCPRLGMLNLAVGGSFTSRLNQSLREDHGWTYGAVSRLKARRAAGMLVVHAAIRADAISDALRETRREIDAIGSQGLSGPEVEKLRALVQGDALETYGTIRGALGSLASNAALGLGPDEDARRLHSQLGATSSDLAALASKQLDISAATVVLVGPKNLALKAISDNGLPPPEYRDPEGRPARSRSGR